MLQSRLLVLRHEEEQAKKKELAGDVKASWGDQMRSYVLQPYQMVKDLRTEYESGNPQSVFDGDIDGFINAGIRWRKNRAEGRSGLSDAQTRNPAPASSIHERGRGRLRVQAPTAEG